MKLTKHGKGIHIHSSEGHTLGIYTSLQDFVWNAPKHDWWKAARSKGKGTTP